MKIVADDHIHYLRDYFQNVATLVQLPGRDIHANDVADADVLLVRSITKVNATLLLNAKVRFVGSITAGADHLDIPWLQQQGIAYALADGFNAPPVSDYVVSIIAALQKRHLLLQPRPKAAVIGVGQVGKRVVERLQWLGFDVTQCDPLRAQNEPDFISTPLSTIRDMDLVSVHVPLTQSGEHATKHLLKDDFFHRQNAGCVFVNASRGLVVGSRELMHASAYTHLCLDVFEHEPLIEPALLSAAYYTTPHIAGYSVQSKLRGMEMIYQAMVQAGIVPNRPSPITMPVQTLAFAGKEHSWRDIVLGVFNPTLMTTILREKLKHADNPGLAFDQLRNQFAYRHEFTHTRVSATHIDQDDIPLLKKLGFQLV